MRNVEALVLCVAGASASAGARSAHADDAAPATDLAAAAAAVGAPADPAAEEDSAADPATESATTFEAKLHWQSRSVTDYWYRDIDARGRRTSSVEFAVEMEHPLSGDWRLWTQVDAWFDARDVRWSSSQTDSVAFVAALRRDVGAGFELELGVRYDDWVELHATKGDPWGPYAMLSCTFDAFGGELCPYVYHELRNTIGGDRHDGTWITEAGAEFSMPLADAWTLELAVLAGRVDGSRTDPDVWGFGASAGVAWQWTECTSIGLSVGLDGSAGADVPNRALGHVAVELTWSF